MTLPDLLYRLEQLDADLEKHEWALTQARQVLVQNPELAAAEMRLENMQVEQRRAQAELRGLEADLVQLEDRIKRADRRMYGGQIVDSRELTSLQREIEVLTVERGRLEERILLLMEQVEEIGGVVSGQSREVDSLRDRWNTDRPTMEMRAVQIADDLAALRTKREEIIQSINSTDLQLYRRLRATTGHAVSLVSNGTCQQCRVTVPSKDLQHARAGMLVHCGNCSRILVAGT